MTFVCHHHQVSPWTLCSLWILSCKVTTLFCFLLWISFRKVSFLQKYLISGVHVVIVKMITIRSRSHFRFTISAQLVHADVHVYYWFTSKFQNNKFQIRNNFKFWNITFSNSEIVHDMFTDYNENEKDEFNKIYWETYCHSRWLPFQ